MRALLCLVVAACAPGMKLVVHQPTSVVVAYISGHNLFPGPYPDVYIRNDEGALVRPAHEHTWWIEAHRTVKYWVLRPGEYRLLNDTDPSIKTIRKRGVRMLATSARSELDAKTGANDERGNTTETWHVPRANDRPYFVFVHETTENEDNVFYEVLGMKLDPGRGSDEERANMEAVGDAKWVGPLSGPKSIRISTPDTDVHRYTIRVVDGSVGPVEARTVPVGTTVKNYLGPRSEWHPESASKIARDNVGWFDSIVFTNDQERTLYVAVSWKRDAFYFDPPRFEIRDDAGVGIALESVYDTARDQRGPPGVFATTVPVAGALHVRVRSRYLGLTSGTYTLCVAADEKTCARDGLVPEL